jgi:drug/metabolite transporter (DMT)-like permease
VVLCIFLYKLIFDKTKPIIETFRNYRKLTIMQILSLCVMAFLAVGSSIFIYEFDINYNTPLINSMFIKIASTLSLVVIGIFLFEEKYSWKQIFGVFLTILGVILIAQK